MALVPQVVDAVGEQVPVVAAGGLFDGRSRGVIGPGGGRRVDRHEVHRHPRGQGGRRLQGDPAGHAEDGTVVSRAYTGKTCRVVRNDWTQHFDEHPEELKPFLQQAIYSAQEGANHLGYPDGTEVDVRREFYPCGQEGARSTSSNWPAPSCPAWSPRRRRSSTVSCSRRSTWTTTVLADARAVWRDEITPILHDYIAIPAVPRARRRLARQRPHRRAVDLVADWCRARPIAGLTVDVAELSDHTPLIVIDACARRWPGRTTPCSSMATSTSSRRCTAGVTGSPWTPVVEGDRLYGRGADDGYAGFASLAAIEAVQRRAGPRPMPGARRSQRGERLAPPAGPPGALAELIGTPSLVVCLDSGCNDYERLWVTTSTGLAGGTLTVDILEEGVHSGAASGVVPSTFASPATSSSGWRTRRRARSGSPELTGDDSGRPPPPRRPPGRRRPTPSATASSATPDRCPTTPSSRSWPTPGDPP